MTTNRHCEERNGVEQRSNPIIQRGNLYFGVATQKFRLSSELLLAMTLIEWGCLVVVPPSRNDGIKKDS